MIKKLIKTVFLAFILFSLISFVTFLATLIYHLFLNQGPKMYVGFPFNYYYQFYVGDACGGFELMHGTNARNFILDYFFNLIIVFLIDKFYLKHKTTT